MNQMALFIMIALWTRFSAMYTNPADYLQPTNVKKQTQKKRIECNSVVIECALQHECLTNENEFSSTYCEASVTSKL